jgi:predicted N-formylglutamate amidohydrolase
MAIRVLITAEHGGNEVPPEYAALFAGAGDILATHRGWDPGSLVLASLLADRLRAPLISATVTRLLVDLNRKPSNGAVFSEFTRPLEQSSRQTLLERYHTPHRSRVEQTVRSLIEAQHRVIHIGMHSFTPELRGEVRNADVGFLYDPSRVDERSLCLKWRQALSAARRDLRIRLNYPYLGTADGLTTALREVFEPDQYIGVEVEVNQRWPLNLPSDWPMLQNSLVDSFETAIESFAGRSEDAD